MKAIRLQVNHRSNPLGIDDTRYRFTWNAEVGISQKAYRIRVWDEADSTVDDSGKISGSGMHCMPEIDAKSRRRLNWSFTLWDEAGREETSGPAWFETGLFPKDWRAEWNSPYCMVKSRWERTQTGFRFEIEVPANTAAAITLSDGRTETVTAGRYTYEV